MKYMTLQVDQVDIPEERVTSYFDQDTYKEFQSTIAKMGIIEPIVCVQVEDHFVLVDGLHRLQEAKEHKVGTIQAVVIPGDEEDVFLTNLFLNIMRGKTRVGEVRRVIEILADQYKLSGEKICKRTGLSKQYVIDMIRIGELPDLIVQAFDDGLLSKGAAVALTRISSPDLQLRVYLEISGRNLSIEDIEDIIKLLKEEAHELEPPPTRSEPSDRQEKAIQCDICHKENPVKFLRSILVCPDCEAAHSDILVKLEHKESA